MKYNFDKTPDHRKTASIRWKPPDGRNDVLGMGTADLDFCCPPCVREALEAVCMENIYNYRYKPESYYESLMGWFDRKFSLPVSREWISSIPGTLAAVHMAIRLFAKSGDPVIVQTPHFMPLQAGIEGAGCRFLPNPMVLRDGRYELDLEDFEEKVRTYRPSLFLLVNPQNPTGRVFTRQELNSLVDICAKYQVKIISDEVHFLITYDGKKHIPIYAVSETARDISVMIFSYSKGFNIMSLPHALVLIANREMREAWNRFIHAFNFDYASNSCCIAAVSAVTSNEADEWLDQLTQYLQENRDRFMAAMKAGRAPFFPLKPEASFLLWIDCRSSGYDPLILDQLFLEKAGISLNNGLSHGEAGRGFVRMNFGVTRAVLEAALQQIEAAFGA